MQKRQKEMNSEFKETELFAPFDAFSEDFSSHVVRFRKKVGDSVSVGDVICTVVQHQTSDDTSCSTEMKSSHDGTILNFLVAEGQTFEADSQPVCRVEYCLHNVVLNNNTCIACGRVVSERSSLVVINAEGGMKMAISHREAQVVSSAMVSRLCRSKKLSLVLDLDHTLVHCTDDVLAFGLLNRSFLKLNELVVDGRRMVLKQRPGLAKFLHNMKEKYFEMHVYTAGTRLYAKAVCEVIDPTGEFFANRIVSRDDNPELDASNKQISRLFPGDQRMVCIVDDRGDVWDHSPNLLTCEPFHYHRFRGMHEVNNPSELEEDTVNGEQERDIGLERVEEILIQLHDSFYSLDFNLEAQVNNQQGGKDTREILARLKRNVFSKKMFFMVDPEVSKRDEVIRMVKSCGGTVLDTLDQTVTHVIAERKTELAKAARYFPNASIWVVKPEWLGRCAHMWRYLSESKFSIFSLKRASLNPAEGRAEKIVEIGA